MRKIFLIFAIVMLFLPGVSFAQLISVKSVPIAAGDQFLVFPSQNLGMGNVSIALDDPLADPFINPAKGIRINGVQLFGAPTFYNITEENGSARTLPFGVLFSRNNWFGGFTLAAQQLQGRETSFFLPDVRPTPEGFVAISQMTLEDKNASNLYVSGLLGASVSSNLSVAGSIFWADLEAVEGVDLLYPRSQGIKQFGNVADVRLGFLGKLDNRRFYEVLLLYNHFDMTHDVNYGFIFFDDIPQDVTTVERIDRNLDRTDTWGIHLGYVQPLNQNDWNIGGILTANYKTHPKIPNYELMNIPRDPGNSWAFATGIGVSRKNGVATFGADLIFEPIWSHTWAEAAETIITPAGNILAPGNRTVENDFQFTNWLLKLGLERQSDIFGFQLGLQIRWINYWLDQTNYVQVFDRSQRESWSEWTPSLGLNFNFPEFNIRYTGRFTGGTGQPGIERFASFDQATDVGGDFIIAPAGALTLQEAVVMNHQITVSIPIRN